MRVSVKGHRLKFGLGRYPAVGLARARQLAQDAHRNVAEGKPSGVRAKRREQAPWPRASSPSSRRSTVGSPRPLVQTRAPNPTGSVSSRSALISLRCMLATSQRSKSPMSLESCESWPRNCGQRSHTAIRAIFDYAIVMLEPHGVGSPMPLINGVVASLGWSPKSRAKTRRTLLSSGASYPPSSAELGHTTMALAACASSCRDRHARRNSAFS